MFEHRREPLLPLGAFLLRQVTFAALAVGIVLGSLGLGMLGYHALEGLSWLDAFLNASMILGGMGPVNELHSAAGKLFAGCYALYSGVVFLASVGLLFAPMLHRLLHHLHQKGEGPGPTSERPR